MSKILDNTELKKKKTTQSNIQTDIQITQLVKRVEIHNSSNKWTARRRKKITDNKQRE